MRVEDYSENYQTGWVKSYRSMMSKWWYKKSEYFHLWHHILYKATHKEMEVSFNGDIIKLQPGQFITGRKKLSEETGINETKLERCLTYFEKNEHQIEQQKTNRNRLISVINWHQYQQHEQLIEQPVNNKRTTNEHKQELKNIKNNTYKQFYDNQIKLSTGRKYQSQYKQMVDFLLGNNDTCEPLNEVLKIGKQIKYESFEKLKDRIDKNEIKGPVIFPTLEAMNNWKDLHKRKDAYLTLKTWIFK